jgi:hypothetical protein
MTNNFARLASPSSSTLVRRRIAGRALLLVFGLGTAGCSSSASSTPADASACSALATCCGALSGVEAMTCQSIADSTDTGSSGTCAASLGVYQESGLCAKAGVGVGVDGGGSDGAASALVDASPGVSFVVHSSFEVSGSLGSGSSVTSGSAILVVDVTLSNAGVANPLPVNGQYTLTTSDHIVRQVTSLYGLPASCDEDTSLVALEGSAECQVAFELPSGLSALTVSYEDAAGDVASALIPPPPVACTGFDVPDGGSEACNECLGGASLAGQSLSACTSSLTAFNESCFQSDELCEQATTVEQRCVCQRTWGSAACQALGQAQWNCAATNCSTACN